MSRFGRMVCQCLIAVLFAMNAAHATVIEKRAA
jgi:hypothetical protein